MDRYSSVDQARVQPRCKGSLKLLTRAKEGCASVFRHAHTQRLEVRAGKSQHKSSRLCLLQVHLQLWSFSCSFSIVFMNIATNCFSVISLVPCLNPTSVASLFLCPSVIYFSLINGPYKDLELILTGFSFFFFTKWKNPFISG